MANKVHHSTVASLSRNLSLLQKIWFINTYVLSKVWFTAKIYPPRKQDTQTIEKYAGFYIWRSYPYRVARQQLRLPLHKGGLGLIDVSLKCQAIMAKTLHDITMERGDQFEFTYFSRYLNQRHQLFKEYPRFLMDSFIQRDKLFMFHTIKLEKISKIYQHLLNETNYKPDIETRCPNTCWSLTWLNLKRAPLLPEWRTTLYLIINQAVATRDKLHRHNRVDSPNCTHCQQVESLTHKFIFCQRISPVWSWLRLLLEKKLNPPTELIQKLENLRIDVKVHDEHIKNSMFWLYSSYLQFIIMCSSETISVCQFKRFIIHARWQLLRNKVSFSLSFGTNLLIF